jgi:hypothetical protein
MYCAHLLGEHSFNCKKYFDVYFVGHWSYMLNVISFRLGEDSSCPITIFAKNNEKRNKTPGA